MPPKKRKRKKKQSVRISENGWALIFIFAGIFLFFSLWSDSMGVIGQSIRYLMKGLFSGLAFAVPTGLIAAGVYKLIRGDRFRYEDMRKLPWICTAVCLLMCYGLWHFTSLPLQSPLLPEVAGELMREASRGSGMGMLSGLLTFYLNALVGYYGLMIIALALMSFILLYYIQVDMRGLFKKITASGASIRQSVAARRPQLQEEPDEEDEETIPNFEETQARFEAMFQSPRRSVSSDSVEENGETELKTAATVPDQDYVYPFVGQLKSYPKTLQKEITPRSKSSKVLEATLRNFGVEAAVKQVSQGPTITRYELEPKAGIKVSKITNLTEDLALALAARTIRIEAPIPGKSRIGIEVPNETAEMVNFREIIESAEFEHSRATIAFGLGKDIAGQTVVADIAKMPHLLVAGATGSGKSVCINTLICSILYKYSPAQLRMIMIDPKMVELSIYNGLPHLLVPVVTDMKKAPSALNWAVAEMNRRYKLFAESRVKDINGYNEKAEVPLPRIVIIVDELADLMMVSPKEIEDAICRLAQMARACGMHLVIATQRPSVDVITGLIKANIPSRIAFAVSSQTDSRTILDSGGAEKLLGRGDMLYYPIGESKPLRVQGAFISEEEVGLVTDYIREHNAPIEPSAMQEELEAVPETEDGEEDPLMEEIIPFVLEKEQASISMLQRRFKIGYNRAARIIDELERRGIVSAADGSKPRKVYAKTEG